MAGEKALERRVEDAEQATTRVVIGQRERVGQAVPARTTDSARNAEAYAQKAMEAISGLGAQRDRVRGHLDSAAVRDAYTLMMSAMVRNHEADYRAAETGHERPDRAFRTQAEARMHSAETLQAAREEVARHPQEVPQAQPPREKGFWESLWDGISSVFEAIGNFLSAIGSTISFPFRFVRDAISDAIISSNDEISREVSEEWLSREYLGGTIRARFERSPPVATNESREYFDTIDASYGPADFLEYSPGSSGRYYPGTNHIVLRDAGPERGAMRDPGEGNRRKTIVHEELHYASWLGGGQDIRYRDERGQPHVLGYVTWLHEGLTELHAQQLTRSHGYTPSGVSYPYETAAGFYMQQIVGEEVLRSAYLGGDFTEVRRRMDARLGAGTFDRLAGMERGLEALEFITGKMASAGINFRAWESNPVLSGCFTGIAGLEGT